MLDYFTRTAIALLILICFSMRLYAQNGSPKKATIPGYTFPEDIQDTARKTFLEEFRKGYKVYLITCGVCHNKELNGREIIPDFSLPQLLDYEMRMYQEHGDQLTDRTVSDREMQQIIIFLRYKKPSGILVRPGPANSKSK